MRFFIALTLLLSSSSFAEIIRSRIHSTEGNLLRFENGRVAFLKASLPLLPGTDVEAELDEQSNLRKIKNLAGEETNKSLLNFALTDTIYASSPDSYEPSVVAGGISEAWNIFNRSNPFFKRLSECSDRAHVWAHDEFKAKGTRSMKAFVLFTASYINSVRFKWWFHVAPMYKVSLDGEIKDLVMDFRYADGPKTVKEWTDLFVYTKRPCKVTTKFSEYDVNPQTENCYLMFESMHYRLPGELSDQERKSLWKVGTSALEIKQARRWAFEK